MIKDEFILSVKNILKIENRSCYLHLLCSDCNKFIGEKCKPRYGKDSISTNREFLKEFIERENIKENLERW